MIVAGDIGGTKTNLGLFDVAGGAVSHLDFVPRDRLEARLLRQQMEIHGHVSVEEVLSELGAARVAARDGALRLTP